MATDPFYTKLTVDEFLAMDFGDRKVELVDGVIYSMTGGRRSHMRVQGNILSYLRQALRGSDCSAYADFGVKVGNNTAYYPDVSVECGRPDLGLQDDDLLAQRPTVLIEVLSPTTRITTKKPNCRNISRLTASTRSHSSIRTLRRSASFSGLGQRRGKTNCSQQQAICTCRYPV